MGNSSRSLNQNSDEEIPNACEEQEGRDIRIPKFKKLWRRFRSSRHREPNWFLTEQPWVDDTLIKLKQSLQSNPTSFALRFHQLDEAGGVVIAQAQVLALNSNLVKLKLGFNNLGDAVGNALAQVLYSNSTLKHLGLRSTDLGETAGVALAQALQLNSTLTELCLSENNLGDTTGFAFVQALQFNSTLTALYFTYESLSSTCDNTRQLLLNRNRQLSQTLFSLLLSPAFQLDFLIF